MVHAAGHEFVLIGSELGKFVQTIHSFSYDTSHNCQNAGYYLQAGLVVNTRLLEVGAGADFNCGMANNRTRINVW